MQIKFTKNEMEKLLELLSIADWVLTSMDVEEDERKDDYLKLLQKLYHEAYESGMTKEIEYDEDAKDYYLSEDWEEETQERSRNIQTTDNTSRTASVTMIVVLLSFIFSPECV